MSAATAKDGNLFWRGNYHPNADMQRLREHFASIPQSDWFYPQAQQFVFEIAEAQAEAQREYA